MCSCSPHRAHTCVQCCVASSPATTHVGLDPMPFSKRLEGKKECQCGPEVVSGTEGARGSSEGTPRPLHPEPAALTSVMMKKSSPGSPWTTIFSPSSNCTGSRASATVRRSHFSRDSRAGQGDRHHGMRPCSAPSLFPRKRRGTASAGTAVSEMGCPHPCWEGRGVSP